jgi:hypothetical protein
MATTAMYSTGSMTMTASSTTTAMESEEYNESTYLSIKHEQHQREASIQKLKSNLIRYTRANDRRMLLRSLKDVKYLSYVTLPSPMSTAPSDVPLVELEQQVSIETIVLNNFTIKPTGPNDRKKGSSITQQQQTSGLYSGPCVFLKGLTQSLCESKSNPTSMDSKALYELLIVRMAQTTASADPYVQLNSLLGSSTDLMVLQLSAEHQKTAIPANYIVPTVKKGGSGQPILASGAAGAATTATAIKTIDSTDSNGSGTSKNSNNSTTTATTTIGGVHSNKNLIHLNLFVSSGDVHMTLDMAFEFGLFRRSDVKPNRPWIALRAEVHERTNLSNGQKYRTMSIKTPDLY